MPIKPVTSDKLQVKSDKDQGRKKINYLATQFRKARNGETML